MDWAWAAYMWAWLMLWGVIQIPLVVNPVRTRYMGKKPLDMHEWRTYRYDLLYATIGGLLAGLLYG
jgi:hypothetical protein